MTDEILEACLVLLLTSRIQMIFNGTTIYAPTHLMELWEKVWRNFSIDCNKNVIKISIRCHKQTIGNLLINQKTTTQLFLLLLLGTQECMYLFMRVIKLFLQVTFQFFYPSVNTTVSSCQHLKKPNASDIYCRYSLKYSAQGSINCITSALFQVYLI